MDLRFGGIIEAQLRAAVGDSAVFAKNPDGTWAHIPDPDASILARVQAGDHAYRLSPRSSNLTRRDLGPTVYSTVTL